MIRKKTIKKSRNSTFIPSIWRKIYHYFKGSRPGGWLIATVLILLGEWYSIKSFPLIPTVYATVAIIGIISAGSWINWLFDRELDKFSGKDTSIFKINISPKALFLVSLLITCLCVVLLFFINLVALTLGIILFAVFMIYSAPPLRVKTKPPLDCIANALVFGTIPFFIGWTINSNLLNSTALIIGIIVGLVVISYFLFISTYDIENDKEYSIKTSCTILGFKGSIHTGILIFLVAIITSIIYLGFLSFFTISLIIAFPVVLIIKFKNDYYFLLILISGVYYLLTESILFSLYYYSHSLIPIFLFILILIIGLSVTTYTILNIKD